MKSARTIPLPGLVTREQRYRRRILLGLGGMLVFSTSPIFGHHLPTGLETLFAGKDHLWALCLMAFHLILQPVHLVFHVLFTAGFAYAVWDRFRAWHSSRSVLKPLSAQAPDSPDELYYVARAAGVDPRCVRIVAGLPSPAFTAGWLRPRIYIAQSVTELLDRAEVMAVLAHEAAHVRRRDPLRLSALRFLSCMLFWIPGLRRLADDLADETEIQADDAASGQQPLALASAILKLARWEFAQAPAYDGVGFNDRDLLERRVRRLAGEDTMPTSRINRRSLITALLALGLAWSSGAAVAHPLPPGTVQHLEQHCEQLGRPALLHLFCRGFHVRAHAAECPLAST